MKRLRGAGLLGARCFTNMLDMRLGVLALVALCVALAAPALKAQREKLPPDDYDYVYKTWPTVKKTNTGIRYLIQKEGSGDPAKPGDKVSVLYEGTLLNGTVFDKNQDAAHPFTFRLKRGAVIDGWDQILGMMKPGERRFVIIPPVLAYGSRGQSPSIPRDATLVFTIELLKVERPE